MTRQTKTFLIDRFREMGIAPATRHGQNFLIDLNLQQLIISAAQLQSRDVVLEVGTGTGSLTALMAPHVARVVTVEVDSHLFELASEELFDHDNVVLLREDALRNKNRFNDRVIEELDKALDEDPARQLKLVANLPYNIATPVISNLLFLRHVPHSMTVTIQKELADRMLAKPFTKDYSALSVWIQSQCQVELVRLLAPTVFWPAPKVHSAIIRIVIEPQRRAEIADLKYFHQFTKALFLHRRKFLRANIVAAMKNRLTKPEIDVVLTEMQLGTTTRTEELDVATLLALSDAFRKLVPDWNL